MIENKNVRVVKEDVVIGNGCNQADIEFGSGYDNFQFPLTISFCDHGVYTVKIDGKKAFVKKEE